MTEKPRRPARARDESGLSGRRGIGFETLGAVAERVLADLRERMVSNDNDPLPHVHEGD